MRVATTGKPDAIASMMTFERPSQRRVNEHIDLAKNLANILPLSRKDDTSVKLQFACQTFHFGFVCCLGGNRADHQEPDIASLLAQDPCRPEIRVDTFTRHYPPDAGA